MGTALNTPSQMSDKMSGMFNVMAGMVMLALGTINDQGTAQLRAFKDVVKALLRRVRGSMLRSALAKMPRDMGVAMVGFALYVVNVVRQNKNTEMKQEKEALAVG